MAASLLNTPRAIEMSVFVVRAFVRMRELTGAPAQLAAQLTEIERRVTDHDGELKRVIAALRQLLQSPHKPRRAIGFS